MRVGGRGCAKRRAALDYEQRRLSQTSKPMDQFGSLPRRQYPMVVRYLSARKD